MYLKFVISTSNQSNRQNFFWKVTLGLLCLSFMWSTESAVQASEDKSLLRTNDLSMLGGIQTVIASDKKSLTHPYNKLSDDEMDMFILGRSFFNIPWVEAPSATTARDGLGPLFNANTCISCHPGNGAGFATNERGNIHRSMVFRISRVEEATLPNDIHQGFVADPYYGAQLSINAVHGVLFEGIPEVNYQYHEVKYPDGDIVTLRTPEFSFTQLNYGVLSPETIMAPRVALSLIGLGEIEKISEQDILANADPDDTDQDGISGKANRVYDIRMKQWRLGRFTRKASAYSVKQQVAQAMHHDMGLTTPLIRHDTCTRVQNDCLYAVRKGEIDVPELRLDAVTFYISHLKIPAQRNPEQHREGRRLFDKSGCSSCHKPFFITTESNTIYPFSDFLLHDMGESLSDRRTEYLAQSREWRTTPLWGIGLAKRLSKQATYLHDGRARTIEEAILWHGGEAESSRNRFMKLKRSERQQMIDFLRSI